MNWDLLTLGTQVLLTIGLLIGARYNALNFRFNRETFTAQRFMITALQLRVHMLERILQQAGLVDLGIDDDELQAEIKKLMAK